MLVHISLKVEAFESWIRSSFVEMNTELENLYFAQEDRSQVIGRGDAIKAQLRNEGRSYIVDLLKEGNTGDGFDSAFKVLGNVGMYLGAMRRHELTNPAREERSPFPEASSLALHVGASHDHEMIDRDRLVSLVPAACSNLRVAKQTCQTRIVRGLAKDGVELTIEICLHPQGFIAGHASLLRQRSSSWSSAARALAPAAT